MSDFKVGDKVKCVRADNLCGKLTKGKTYTITSIVTGIYTGGSSVCVDGNRDDWWYADRFELIQPQPIESPDDWVTQDAIPVRPDVDEWRWIDASDGSSIADKRGEWKSRRQITRTMRHGLVDGTRYRLEVRCRRRDYPQQPVEVHTGGPYVARSEYEQVLADSDAKDNAIAELAEHIHQLDRMIHEPTPNGWPLVPVDPSCIPEGYEAVRCEIREHACQAAGYAGSPHVVFRKIEPIPTPAPDTLPRPEFPAWIRAGWWVAMDNDGDWFGYEKEPTLIDKLKQWGSTIPFPIIISQLTPSMRAVPRDRWREAKWQIN